MREEAGVNAGLDLGGSSFGDPPMDAHCEEDHADADDESGNIVREVRHRTSDQCTNRQRADELKSTTEFHDSLRELGKFPIVIISIFFNIVKFTRTRNYNIL